MSNEAKGRIKRILIVLWIIGSYAGGVFFMFTTKSHDIILNYVMGAVVGLTFWMSTALIGGIFYLIGKWIWKGHVDF
jgi:hypothetical protein